MSNRTYIFIGILLTFIIGISFLLSAPGINMIVEKANKDYDSQNFESGAKSLFIAGSIYYWSLRYQNAADLYGEFLDREGADHPLSRHACLRKAVCHEKLSQNVLAVEEYVWFFKTWPNDEKAQDAEDTARRLGHFPLTHEF